MSLKAGVCSVCGAQTWRGIQHPTTGTTIPLWPMPSSRYLIFRLGNGNIVNAIGVCPCYAGQPGDPLPPNAKAQMARDAAMAVERDAGYQAGDLETAALVGSATARERYAAWFIPPYGDHLKAWLKDFVRMEEAAIGRVMQQWQEDRLA